MRRIFAVLAVLGLTFLVLPAPAAEAKVITDKNGSVTIAKTEIINDDVFVGAQTAEIAGTVNGDVFVGAQAVKISGIINGNVHVGANTIDLSGKVKGNVYAGGQTIFVNEANIGGSLILGAANASLDKTTVVGGSVIAGAGNLTLDSQIGRSVYAGTGNFTLGENAKIGKDVYYRTSNKQNPADISTNAKIGGSVFKSEMKTTPSQVNMAAARKELPAIVNTVKLVGTIISFGGALVVAFLYAKLAGKHFAQSAALVRESFGKSLGVGFLVTIALIPGLIVLALTGVGIPLAAVGLLLFLLYGYLAKIVVGSAVGGWAAKRWGWKMTPAWAFVVGLAGIYVLKLIPIIGFLSGLVVFWAGLGALTRRMFAKAS